MGHNVQFTVLIRGYARREVEAFVEYVEATRGSRDPDQRAALRAKVHNVAFRARFCGYDPREVDAYLDRVEASLT